MTDMTQLEGGAITEGNATPPEPAVPAADELLAMTVHEMRSPVAAILGYAETVRDRREDLAPEELDGALAAIARQATRLDRLLADLLLLASGDAGAPPVVTQRVALRDALLRALGDDPASLAVELDCPPGVEVRVDPGRLHQMVTNYVSNARLHGKPPCRVSVEAGDREVSISVHDGGDGVPEHHRSHLFRRFERAGTGGASGIGLGLAVVQALAAANGGRAYYDPGTGGSGHRFVLVLPAWGA
jgi:signal transduction histidine kinase